MTTQTLTIGRRRYVLIAERDFQQLQKRAAKASVDPAFGDDAMQALKSYRRRPKSAVDWQQAKRELGL